MENKEKFKLYADLLQEWNAKFNLVAPSTLDDIETRHIADSAQLAKYLPKDANIIDMGSGAGFPAVVLAIMGWEVTAIESIGKKAGFLTMLGKKLDLGNLTVFNGRLENFLKTHKIKEPVFTARAFAPLVKILNYTKNIKKGRYFLLKGENVTKEIEDAKQEFDFDYELYPSETGNGFILIVKNVAFHVK